MNAKKKKTYAALVGAGLLALLADRLLTSPPADAVAAGGLPTSPAASDLATDPAPGQAVGVAAADFPQNLPDPRGATGLRDAFGLTPAADRAMRGTSPDQFAGDAANGSPLAGRRRMTVARFKERHRLTAVMQGATVAVAVVDDQWVELGQVFDECKLVEITGRSASFQCGDGMAELSVGMIHDPNRR